MKHWKSIPAVCLMVLLSVMIMAVVSGCGGREIPPEEVVGKFCEALKTFDVETIKNQYIHVENSSFTEEDLKEHFSDIPNLWQYIKEQAEKIEYAVDDAVIDGDTATVNVHFTHADVSPAVLTATADFIQQALVLSLAGASDEDMEHLLYATISAKLNTVSPLTTNTDVSFSCLRMKDGWKIDNVSDEELTNVIICNLGRAISSYGNVGNASQSGEETIPSNPFADWTDEDTEETEESLDESEVMEDASIWENEQTQEIEQTQDDEEYGLSDFLGEWEAVDGNYPYMEITPLGGENCHVVITFKFNQIEADGEYDERKNVIMYFDGTYSALGRDADDWTIEEDGCEGWICYESTDVLRWYNITEDYNQYFICSGSLLDEMELNEIAYREAIMDGWGYIWDEVAQHMGSDPSFYFEEAEDDPSLYGGNGNPWDNITINGVTYEMAQKHSWGDAWMDFANHVGTGG